MFELKCRKKGLNLYIEPTGDLPRYVEGDLGKLRQVVINLVGNAVKFTTEGGISLTVGQDGRLFRFSVTDSGKGIPADEIER
jgi:signal transduction histidine kinase